MIKNDYIIDGDVVKIILNRRYGKSDMETLIDLEDLDKVNRYNGKFSVPLTRKNGKYYAKINIYEEDKHYLLRLHRIVMGVEDSKYPMVDHINGDTLDNRKSNLRLVTNSKNLKNRSKENSNSSTGIRNVSLINNKYVVQLQVQGKNTVLGKFDTLEQAGDFAELMRDKYYGEFNGEN